MSDNNEQLATAIEVGFFALLLAYVLVMLTDLPSGDSGLFPGVLLPIVAMLVVIRLLTILVPGFDEVIDRLAAVVLGTEDRGTEDWDRQEIDADEQNEEQVSFETSVELTDSANLLRSIGWILFALASAYLLGILLGGFVFIAAFLWLSGDVSPSKSLGISIGYTALLWLSVTVMDFRIWWGPILG